MSISARIILLIFVLGSPVVYHTQPPQDQLDQLVEKLNKKPDDNVLREQIIKLAGEMKPRRAIPEEARQNFIEAAAIAKTAKDPAGQKLAVVSYEKALLIAPWWGDPYYNLSVTQEVIGDFDEAQNSLKFYILTAPGEKEAREAQDRIYAIGGKKKVADAEAATEAARLAKLKVEVDAKATAELRKANFLNKYRGNYIQLACSLGEYAHVGCTDAERGGVNWRRHREYYSGAEYIYQFKISEDGIEIVPSTGLTSIGTWGEYGIVTKIVGKYNNGWPDWTCHYQGDNRTNKAHLVTFDPDSFTLTCDAKPWDAPPGKRYRYIEFRRKQVL